MPLTQTAHRRLRLVFSIRTAVTVVAAVFGYYVGLEAPEHLADALSVGLTVGAVAFAVAFALGAGIRRSKSPAEMLNRDRELARLGVSSLRSAVTVVLLALSYLGLSGALTHGGRPLALLGGASTASSSLVTVPPSCLRSWRSDTALCVLKHSCTIPNSVAGQTGTRPRTAWNASWPA